MIDNNIIGIIVLIIIVNLWSIGLSWELRKLHKEQVKRIGSIKRLLKIIIEKQ